MTRKRFAVDMEELMVALLSRDLPQALTVAQPDTDVVEHLPFVVVGCGNGVPVSNGPLGLATNWTVNCMVVHMGDTDASDLADELLEIVCGWSEAWDNRGTIAGVGAIVSVDVISMPSRTATTATPAGGLTQYDATFSITARKA